MSTSTKWFLPTPQVLDKNSTAANRSPASGAGLSSPSSLLMPCKLPKMVGAYASGLLVSDLFCVAFWMYLHRVEGQHR